MSLNKVKLAFVFSEHICVRGLWAWNIYNAFDLPVLSFVYFLMMRHDVDLK